jgi:lipopolysaccharide transport system permease protein
MAEANTTWEWEINPISNASLNTREIWQYRHLLASLVKRDFLLVNQQTVLGPLWSLIQPLLTLVIYVLIFSRIVGISTGPLPPVLFYYSGIILWSLFQDCFAGAAGSLKDNAHIFSKVYLPRLVFPLAVGLTQLLRFSIQACLLLILLTWFTVTGHFPIHYTISVFLVPLAVMLVCIAGLTAGLMSAIVAARYRDMFNVISVLIRLMMFATPVIYPLNNIQPGLRWIVQLNPLTSFFELFRYALFGNGILNITALWGGVIVILFFFLYAVRVFVARSNQMLDII